MPPDPESSPRVPYFESNNRGSSSRNQGTCAFKRATVLANPDSLDLKHADGVRQAMSVIAENPDVATPAQALLPAHPAPGKQADAPKLAVLIPCHNEAAAIEGVIAEFR